MLNLKILKVVNKTKTEKVMQMMRSFDEMKAAFRTTDDKNGFIDDDTAYYRYRGEVIPSY